MFNKIYHIKLLPHYCDRCKQMKGGFYYTVGGQMADKRFAKYAREGEADICEDCMHLDPKWGNIALVAY